MERSSSTATTPASSCPVSWCEWGHGDEPIPCTGEHWASPHTDVWPDVTATGDPHQLGPVLSAAPTWGAVDGLEPAVLLDIEDRKRGEELCSIDLRPREARELAAALVRAAEAAEAVAPLAATAGTAGD